MFKQTLNQHGIVATKTRVEILELVANKNIFMNAYDIKEYLNHLDISTIYRTINVLEEKKILSKRYNEDRNCFTFKYVSHSHSHKLTCRACNKVVEIDFCPMNVFDKDNEASSHFIITDYVFELYGYCENCQ